MSSSESSRFDKHDLKCVVISSSSTVRGLLSSILKEQLFTNITAVADIKTCIEIMETEPVAWVISPTHDSIGGHVLHILNIIQNTPALRATKISILRDDDDSTIAHAFELGAFSTHKIETSKEAIQHEFQTLLQRIERYNSDYTRVSADYLRDFLSEKKEYQELKRFYNSMLQVYPNQNDILLDLARSHFMADEIGEARELIGRLLLTAPEKKGKIEELRKQYLPNEELESAPAGYLAERYGFKTCLILDPDQENLKTMEKSAQKVGFKTIVCFQDPISFMKWVRQNPPPDLILSEWQLTDIPGPVFLYKLRHRLDLHVPIIILNRQITERDSLWIKELEISCLVVKPIVEKDLIQSILWTMQQSKGPSDIQSLKTRLKILSKKQDKELPSFRQLYMQHPMLIESDRKLMEAQLALDASCFLHAKKFALEAVLESGDPREALEILSKSLMKLREFDAALRCLDNVNILSPYNVTYLCEIAECHLENGDDKKFESYLDQARDIDPDARVVIETQAKGAMKKGHTDTAKILLQSLKSFKEVLAFMNNKAVALIQVGEHQQGVDLYQKALASIPEGQPEVRYLLSYNLGLGYARAGRLEEARAALAIAASTKNPARQRKVRALRIRVDNAIDSGEPLVFATEKAPSLQDEQEKLKMLQDIKNAGNLANKILREDYCLNKIYRSFMDDSKAKDILADAPTFTLRGKLVKDYILGIKQVP